MNDTELEAALLRSISPAPPSLMDPRMFILLGIEWRRNGLRGWIGVSLAINIAMVTGAVIASICIF